MVNDELSSWFVMRDLKRANAKQPAYKLLKELGFCVFTPMKWEVKHVAGKIMKDEIPVMADLLFVYAKQSALDPIVELTATLQYRWLRNSYRKPMVVDNEAMQCFMTAANATATPKYYLPQEITPDMYGRKVRIVGGTLGGYSGHLVACRGSKKRRLFVEIPGLLALTVEVNPEYIELL